MLAHELKQSADRPVVAVTACPALYVDTGVRHLPCRTQLVHKCAQRDGPFAGVRIEAGSERPVFLGIGPTSDVARYLAGVQHSQITDFDTDPVRFSSREVAGQARPAPPAQQSFWRVRATGSGTQTVTWPLEKGNWSAVAMNADGSRNVSIALRVGARIPALRRVAFAGAISAVFGLGRLQARALDGATTAWDGTLRSVACVDMWRRNAPFFAQLSS